MADSDVQETTPATRSDTPGELAPVSKEEIAAWLRGEDLTTEDDTPEIDLDDALRILSAETPEEALKVSEMRKIDDYDGKTFGVVSVAWRKSTRSDDGQGRYAVMHCVDEHGEQFLTTCGATRVVLQLRKFQVAGWLPAQFELRVTKTDSGNTVKELVVPEKPL